MKKLKKFFEDHPNAVRYLHLGYIVFAGCFLFPLGSLNFKVDSMKIYLLLIAYGIIGFEFFRIYGKDKLKFTYLVSLGLSLVGMGARYGLDLVQLSNTNNFTVDNIIKYILIIPAYIVVVYLITAKRVDNLNSKEE